MNSTGSDLDKTACFFLPDTSLSPIHPFPKKIKNLKIKRTSSQIELPRLTLYTECEPSNRDLRAFSNKLFKDPITPQVMKQSIDSRRGIKTMKKILDQSQQNYLVKQYTAKKSHSQSESKINSQAQSPEKHMSFQNFYNFRVESRGKSFLQRKPQQKLVTRLFGE